MSLLVIENILVFFCSKGKEESNQFYLITAVILLA